MLDNGRSGEIAVFNQLWNNWKQKRKVNFLIEDKNESRRKLKKKETNFMTEKASKEMKKNVERPKGESNKIKLEELKKKWKKRVMKTNNKRRWKLLEKSQEKNEH